MTGLPRSDSRSIVSPVPTAFSANGGAGLPTSGESMCCGIFAEAGEEDEDDRRDDDDADDENRPVHATTSSSIVGALSGTTTYVRRRAGISAIKPPRPIIMTAPQIQPTIGMLMMSTPAWSPCRFMIEM